MSGDDTLRGAARLLRHGGTSMHAFVQSLDDETAKALLVCLVAAKPSVGAEIVKEEVDRREAEKAAREAPHYRRMLEELRELQRTPVEDRPAETFTELTHSGSTGGLPRRARRSGR